MGERVTEQAKVRLTVETTKQTIDETFTTFHALRERIDELRDQGILGDEWETVDWGEIPL